MFASLVTYGCYVPVIGRYTHKRNVLVELNMQVPFEVVASLGGEEPWARQYWTRRLPRDSPQAPWGCVGPVVWSAAGAPCAPSLRLLLAGRCQGLLCNSVLVGLPLLNVHESALIVVTSALDVLDAVPALTGTFVERTFLFLQLSFAIFF